MTVDNPSVETPHQAAIEHTDTSAAASPEMHSQRRETDLPYQSRSEARTAAELSTTSDLPTSTGAGDTTEHSIPLQGLGRHEHYDTLANDDPSPNRENGLPAANTQARSNEGETRNSHAEQLRSIDEPNSTATPDVREANQPESSDRQEPSPSEVAPLQVNQDEIPPDQTMTPGVDDTQLPDSPLSNEELTTMAGVDSTSIAQPTEQTSHEFTPVDPDADRTVEQPRPAHPEETAQVPSSPETLSANQADDLGDANRPVQQGEVERYSVDDLTPTGRFDPSNPNRELLHGPDGRNHFPGDRIGTFRDRLGDLHDSNGYASDDNRADEVRLMDKGPSETLTPDLQTPEGAAFDSAVADYRSIAAARDSLWTSEITPITDRLAAAGLPPVDKASFGGASFPAYEAAAAEHLTRADRLALRTGAETWRQLHRDQVAAGECLGSRAGDYIAAQKFPMATVVTGGTEESGTSGNFDRTLFQQEPPKFVIFEEKGAGSRLETRWVPNPSDPSGPEIKSQQCSPEYVRGVAPIDNKMAVRLGGDQDLASRMQQTVTGTNGGTVECWVVRGLPTGKITLTQAIMNPQRLLREGIRLSGYQERGTT